MTPANHNYRYLGKQLPILINFLWAENNFARIIYIYKKQKPEIKRFHKIYSANLNYYYITNLEQIKLNASNCLYRVFRFIFINFYH